VTGAEAGRSAVARPPARLSGAVAAGAGLLAAGVAGFYSWPALGAGAVGIGLLVAGLVRGQESAVTLGATALLAGGLAAGARGAPAGATLASVAATVVAWDVGRRAIGVGRQLGREADTRRLEVVHAAASAGVAAVTAVVGYGLFRAATGDQPAAALAFLLIAAVLLVEALR